MKVKKGLMNIIGRTYNFGTLGTTRVTSLMVIMKAVKIRLQLVDKCLSVKVVRSMLLLI